MLKGQLLIKAPLDLRCPFCTGARDRPGLTLALGIQRAAALPQPRPPTLRPGHKPLRVKLELNLLDDRLARLLLSAPLGLKLLARGLERCAAALARAQRFGQLVSAGVAVALILLAIGLLGLLENLGHNRLIGAVAIPRGVGAHFRAIDRDHAHRDQARLATQRQDIHE